MSIPGQSRCPGHRAGNYVSFRPLPLRLEAVGDDFERGEVVGVGAGDGGGEVFAGDGVGRVDHGAEARGRLLHEVGEG